MTPRVRWIVPLCFVSFLWAFAFGASAPLASLWLQDKGIQDSLIGLNTGTYYLGIVVAASLVPRLLERWGKTCLVFGMIASGLTMAFFPWCDWLPGWFALRALNGVAGALSLVPLETFVNRESCDNRRARNFGCYAFCIALGMALGTLVGMAFYSSPPKTAFLASGLAPLLGAIVILAWQPTFSATTENGRRRASFSMLRNFLSFGSTWSQGFLEGGMIGLLPLYLLHVGLSDTTASCLMSGLMIGVILAQLPVAWLADRFGRVGILAACNVLAMLGLVGLLVQPGTLWLAIFLFVVGACSGAFYPLGLALLGDRIPSSALACANGRYLAINSLGSLVGPAVAGAAMDRFGRAALFTTGAAAVGAMFAAWLALEIGFKMCKLKTASSVPPRVEEPQGIAA
jgi:MFS family permease